MKKFIYVSVSLFAYITAANAMTLEDEQEKSKNISASQKLSSEQTNDNTSLNSQVPYQKRLSQEGTFTLNTNNDISEADKEKTSSEDSLQVNQKNPPSTANRKIPAPSELLNAPRGGGSILISIPPLLNFSEDQNNILGSENVLFSPAMSLSDEKIQSSGNSISKALGISEIETNLATYFFNEETLSERSIANFYGPNLILDNASLQLNPKTALIFDALIRVKSVKNLSLVETKLSDTHYMALINALTRNKSLRRVNFTKATFSEKILLLLGTCLESQKTLKSMILRPQFVFTEKHVESFYDSIKGNQGLRLIIWPDDKKIEKKIRALADKGNRVAALHYGNLLATGVLSQDIKEALKYLNKAYEGGHSFASYEIGRLKEKQGKIMEALEWYQKSANEGHPKGLVKIGDYHRAIWPLGTQANPDYQKAYQHYKWAADQESPKALYRIGRMYESGKFVEKSLDKAASLFYQCIEWGYPDAFPALGALYSNPEYSGYDPESGKYYLEWGKRFKKTEPVSNRMLSYFQSPKT